MDIPTVSLGGSATQSRGIDWGKEPLKLVGAKMLLRKCVNDDPYAIILPDILRTRTRWFRIERVGERCSTIQQSMVGWFLYVEVAVDGLYVLDDKYVIAHERAIGQGIRPFVIDPNGDTHELR